MSDIAGEPAFHFFSHVRRALGALGLAALGALVLVGLLPLVAGNAGHNQPETPAAEQPRPRTLPEASLSK